VSGHGIRLGMVLIPLITYACSVAVHGNGFVAAFIAGITYRLTRFKGEGTRDEARLKEEVSLLDGIGENASLLMWFVFGSTVSIIFLTPVEWAWILFGVLALTVLRFVPVVLAFIGSKVPFRERAVFGLMGPRGTSTIVFGLLTFNAMQNDDDVAVLYVMVVTVLASVILHGFFGTRLSKRILGRGAADGSTISSPIREERPRA
jgi:NhaP-type Na+/H+ or K+/H+ antiporter